MTFRRNTDAARAALEVATDKMKAASVRLEAEVSEGALEAFIEASRAASAAHGELLLAALERARRGRGV